MHERRFVALFVVARVLWLGPHGDGPCSVRDAGAGDWCVPDALESWRHASDATPSSRGSCSAGAT